ncbi:MAG: hypothetical protein Q9209_003825 [Squamulea sp. 1 TL-2023]
MASKLWTLADYLRHANPQLECGQCREGSNHASGSSTVRGYKNRPDEVAEWDDFGLAAFDSLHNGALQEELKRQHRLLEHPIIPKLPFRDVHDENSLEALLILWNWQVVSEALAATQKESWKLPSNEAVYMVRGGQSYMPYDPRTEDAPRPDWGGVRRPADESQVQDRTKLQTILPGETKPSIKWSSTWIPTDGRNRDWKKDVANPIGQIYQYCIRANARYGYLITDQELVAVRIDLESVDDFHKRIGGQRKRRLVTLRYKSIPWDTTTSTNHESMTINLALWMLHLVAARDKDGKITTDDRTLHEALHTLARERSTPGPGLDQAPTTPAETISQQASFAYGPDKSFTSTVSDTRQLFSGASIGDDGTEVSPRQSRAQRKRGLDTTSDEESLEGRRRSSRRPKKRH